mmetsp:Transcript_73490/g.162572  ORF Transcript_73490/g.162572 Transcript_73490/m.162572 type:complete len:261 (+) Transcript_73490:1437-2219(+)
MRRRTRSLIRFCFWSYSRFAASFCCCKTTSFASFSCKFEAARISSLVAFMSRFSARNWELMAPSSRSMSSAWASSMTLETDDMAETGGRGARPPAMLDDACTSECGGAPLPGASLAVDFSGFSGAGCCCNTFGASVGAGWDGAFCGSCGFSTVAGDRDCTGCSGTTSCGWAFCGLSCSWRLLSTATSVVLWSDMPLRAVALLLSVVLPVSVALLRTMAKLCSAPVLDALAPPRVIPPSRRGVTPGVPPFSPAMPASAIWL